MSDAVTLGFLTLAGSVVAIIGMIVSGWISRRAILAAKDASDAATAESKAAATLLQAEMAALKHNMDGHMSKIIAMSEEAAANAAEVKGRDKEIAAQDQRTSRVAGLIKGVEDKVDAVAAVVKNGPPSSK